MDSDAMIRPWHFDLSVPTTTALAARPGEPPGARGRRGTAPPRAHRRRRRCDRDPRPPCHDRGNLKDRCTAGESRARCGRHRPHLGPNPSSWQVAAAIRVVYVCSPAGTVRVTGLAGVGPPGGGPGPGHRKPRALGPDARAGRDSDGSTPSALRSIPRPARSPYPSPCLIQVR